MAGSGRERPLMAGEAGDGSAGVCPRGRYPVPVQSPSENAW
jgi:hypothetical protein